MKAIIKMFSFASILLISLSLVACGGGGGGSDGGVGVGGNGEDAGGGDAGDGTSSGGGDGSGSGSPTAFELLDPTPGRDDNFGSHVVILSNGNIVVADPGDSSIARNNGAVHLYSSGSQSLVGSVYGDQANDRIGLTGITALGGNFIISSENDNSGTVTRAGSVRLVNGSTGREIAALVGNDADDRLGSHGITVLANGNYLATSVFDDNGELSDAGSIRLMNGSTGSEIRTLFGSLRETLGLGGVTALGNSNYVIASPRASDGFNASAGSVRLMNGATGESINTLFGTQSRSQLGDSGVTALTNNNYVITSSSDDDGSRLIGGSVRLVNGDTGVEVSALFGDEGGDFFSSEIVALSNSHYVIISPDDNHDADRDVGSVRLMNGNTGAEINAFFGDQPEDSLGFRRRFFGVVGGGGTALTNGNYVVASSLDDNALIADAGSVRLFDGSTGAQINVQLGDEAEDQFGSEGVTALSNSNYVIASNFDDNGAIESAGSVYLMDGTSGGIIGAPFFGDQAEDRLASDAHSVVALDNGNYVFASPFDDNGAVSNAGAVRLVNGSTGELISALIGDQANDQLGSDLLRSGAGVTPLGNSSYVVISRFDDDSASGVVNSGSVRQLDGDTGVQINIVVGSSRSDLSSGIFDSSIHAPADGSYYVLAAPMWDNNGEDNSGLVRLITP